MTYAEPNGGFPEPPPGVDLTVVSVRDERCGATTRIRLPRIVPVEAIRRVICESCARALEGPAVRTEGVVRAASGSGAAATPLSRLRARLAGTSIPEVPLPSFDGPAWRYLSVPLTAAAVIGALALIQGSGGGPSFTTATTAHDATGATAGAPAPDASKSSEKAKQAQKTQGAHLVKGPQFSLAMPNGWETIKAPAGATFAAQAADGSADATLWQRRDPSLDFTAFEAQSLEQLRSLAGSAKVVKRVAAPTAEASVVTLAANAPADAPKYEVTLRQSGPYSYYLATTVQPSANADATKGVSLIQRSFLPEGTQ
jgi:hypothetical protein